MNTKIVLILLVITFLGSCKINLGKGKEMLTTVTSSRSELLTLLQNEESIKIKEMSNEIIRCFTKNDKAALEKLFSIQIRNRPNFNNDIDMLFKYFKCDTYINSEIKTNTSGGESRESGRRTMWYVMPDIPYISVLVSSEENAQKMMKSRYYSIKYSWCIINEIDTTLEGLYYIEIELLNIDKINLGEYNLLWE